MSICFTKILLLFLLIGMPAFKMVVSNLKLNHDETEFIVSGSKAQCQKLSSYFPVNILDALLHPANIVRNLDVWFDVDHSFSEHVQKTCEACFLQCMFFLESDSMMLHHTLVISRLDYCDSLCRCLSCLINTSCRVFRMLLIVYCYKS